MTRFLPRIFLDYSSFWAGALLALLVIYLLWKFRTKLPLLGKALKDRLAKLNTQLSPDSERDYLQVLYKFVQGLHITSATFPLDSVLIPARCIAPPPALFPGQENLDPSLIQQTLGHDPYLPDLAAEYFAPVITLLESLRTGANICLLGFPGTGKTTAIAAVISHLLKNDQDEYRKIPFYTKAHHILAQFPGKDLLAILLAALQTNPAFRAIPGFPKFLTSAINSGKALLFIDDLDLLTHGDTNRLANFLSSLSSNIPALQLVVTGNPACLGNLVRTPVEFVSIAPWTDTEKKSFLKQWARLWPVPEDGQGALASDTSEILNGIQVASDPFSTPLEFTLRSWAAYAGDLLGPSSQHNLEAYLKRCFPTNTEASLHALETLALHTLEQETSSFTRKDVSTWFAEITSSSQAELSDDKISSLTPVLQIAHEFGMIHRDGRDGFYFSNASLGGYLAARALRRASKQIVLRVLAQPGWSLKYETMRYLSPFVDTLPYIEYLQNDPALLKENLIQACAWLSPPQINPAAELDLLKTITRGIHAHPAYLVKLRLAVGLAKSGNVNGKSIFQHLLKSEDLDTRRAAALAAGLIKDLSAVPFLINQLNDPFPSSTAACYALGRIASPRSLEAIAEGLLHGNELLRRAAAESLAQNRSEGHPALREGATREDLLVRYAVVHGLSQIKESWAIEILDKMRIEEDEWIVRDLAQQAYHIHENGSPYLPSVSPPAHAAPWLIAFADKRGFPRPTPETALELLLQALEQGSDEEKQASLHHFRKEGSQAELEALLGLFRHPNPSVRQLAMLTAWYCLPPAYSDPPQQFA